MGPFKEKVLNGLKQKLDQLGYKKHNAIVARKWREAHESELLLDELQALHHAIFRMEE